MFPLWRRYQFGWPKDMEMLLREKKNIAANDEKDPWRLEVLRYVVFRSSQQL